MARKKKPTGWPETPFVAMTPNQVVAFNLAAARRHKGWTQEEAAAAMEPHLGVRWSKASVSQAERSVDGGFVRNFSADEIVAFARTYELPITWFFLPPPATVAPGVATRLDVPDGPVTGEAMALLVDLIFGDESQQWLMSTRLRNYLGPYGSVGLTAAQARIVNLVRARTDALVGHALSDLGTWQTMLRSLANQLEDLEGRSANAAAVALEAEARTVREALAADASPVDELSGGAGGGESQSGDTPADVQTSRRATPRDKRAASAKKSTTKRS